MKKKLCVGIGQALVPKVIMHVVFPACPNCGRLFHRGATRLGQPEDFQTGDATPRHFNDTHALGGQPKL
jgi:predicted RNA-binding Zn-ribbon protein involved in translation (DUF1610 family)